MRDTHADLEASAGLVVARLQVPASHLANKQRQGQRMMVQENTWHWVYEYKALKLRA